MRLPVSHSVGSYHDVRIAGRQGAERQRLLHTVIVGGGPTGVEFAGELSDFIGKDLAQVDNDRARDMRCARLPLCSISMEQSDVLTAMLLLCYDYSEHRDALSLPMEPCTTSCAWSQRRRMYHQCASASRSETLLSWHNRVTLIEASELLGNFDGKLREYAAKSLVRAGVHLMKGLVKEVRDTSMTLADGQVLTDVTTYC